MATIDEIMSILGLKPLPAEGGYFVETYRAEETYPKAHLPSRYVAEKSFGTAIYYLLTPDTFSALHRLPSDEVYHFYLGDPVDMLQLWPDGTGKILTIGSDLLEHMLPQALAPKGVWQGSRLRPGGRYALMGTTVAPGFDFSDYEGGHRDALLKAYPQYSDWITALTR